jgi:hypothetical protein
MDERNPSQPPTEIEVRDGTEQRREPAETAGGPEYIHPAPMVAVPRTRLKKRRWPWWILAVVIVAALVVAGFLLFGRKKAAAPSTTAGQSSNQAANQSPSVPTTTAETGTSEYTSPAGSFNLSFTYPSAWTVSPPSGQAGQTITATSPIVNLMGAGGASAPGRVTLTIQPGGSSVTGLTGTATTAQDSVQYAYDAPTAAQHHYFYVSFVHAQTATSSAKGAFELVVITGVNSLAKGTAVTNDTFGSVDPLVTASFSKCTTQACTGSGMTSFSADAAAWQTDPTFKQLQALFESFKFN